MVEPFVGLTLINSVKEYIYIKPLLLFFIFTIIGTSIDSREMLETNHTPLY
jgi:hypothetical protein